MKDRVRFDMTRDEALVLFEFLSRFSDTDALSIDDEAERSVLWNLQSMMESQ